MTLIESIYQMVYGFFDGYTELPAEMQSQAEVLIILFTWTIFIGLIFFLFKLIQWVFRVVL